MQRTRRRTSPLQQEVDDLTEQLRRCDSASPVYWVLSREHDEAAAAELLERAQTLDQMLWRAKRLCRELRGDGHEHHAAIAAALERDLEAYRRAAQR